MLIDLVHTKNKMFSNLNKPAFGGGSANTSFGFGSSTSSQNPFGGQTQLFGKPSGSTPFGSTAPTFGQSSSSSMFPGTQQQAGGLFQSSTPSFGASTSGQAGFSKFPGSNVFGSTSQQPASSNLFGGSTFGQQNKTAGFGFGGTTAQPSLFGQSQPQPQQSGSPFQASTSSALFGSGGFGQPAPTGTIIKFQPLTSTDTMQKSGVTTTINTKHICITCMKEYEMKSLEELRWEDYQANRKGPQQPGFGGSSFSSVSSTMPMFGQPQENKPAFGQTAGSFGNSFGMGAAQTSSPQNIFGKPGGGFATTTTTANAFGFGTNTLSSGPFSKPFGAASTSQPLFGGGTQQTNTFGGGMFSQQPQQQQQQQQQQNAAGLFGKPQTSSAFGTGSSSFSFSNQPGSQATSIFSTSKPSSSFPTFGQTNTTAPVFGQQQNAFGQTNQPFGSSTFGKPTVGGFGQTNQSAFGTGLGMQQGSLFSGLSSKPGGSLFAPAGTGNFFSTSNMQTQTLMGQQLQPQLLQLPSEKQNEEYKVALNISDQFGQLAQLSRIHPDDSTKKPEMSRTTKPEDIEQLLIRPTSPPTENPMKSKMVPSDYRKPSIFDGLGEEMSFSSAMLLKPRKRLVVKHKLKSTQSPVMNVNSNDGRDVSGTSASSQLEKELAPSRKSFTKHLQFAAEPEVIPDKSTSKESSSPGSGAKTYKTQGTYTTKSLLLGLNDVAVTSESSSSDNESPRTQPETNPVVKLKRPQYYTIPSLEMLENLRNDDGKCYIKGFTVGRVGYGNVCFPDTMDVSNLDLDDIVHIRHREVVLYPDDTRKPPIGQGLNRRAQVTFDGVFPVVSGEIVKKPDAALVMYFTDNLREVCERKGMRFLEYRPDTGSFVFEVEHFSKYGLDNEDINVDANKLQTKKKNEQQQQQPPSKMGETSKQPQEVEVVNNFTDDDIINGLGGLCVPDIEMTDMITSSSESKEHSDCEGSKEHNSFTDDYITPMRTTFDLPNNDYRDRAKEVHLIKSALYFDQITEIERDLDAAVTSSTSVSRRRSTPAIMTTVAQKPKPIDLTLLQPEVFKVRLFYDIPYIPPVSIADLGVYKGKSAKIGWMRGTTFIKPEFLFDKTSYFALTDALGTPFKLQTACTDLPGIELNSMDFIEYSLRIFQEECDCIMDRGVPLFRLAYPHKFVKQQIAWARELTQNSPSKETLYFRDIWTLCWALFGPMRNSQSNRMIYFNQWLKEVVSPAVEAEKRAIHNQSEEEILQQIYVHLTGRRIKEAAKLAMEHNLPELSLNIAAFSVSNAKDFLAMQINDWKRTGAIKYFSETMIKIYLLLSGTPVCGATNICNDLEWLRAFAVHVWYVSSHLDPLGNAVESFEKAFKELCYATTPVPSYYKGNLDKPPYDILYQIILLFTKKNVTLNSVLNPATYTNNMTDYRLSWFLLQVFTALKVGVISEHARNYICISFANQLEQMDMWPYAIFVLLFITSNSIKKELIQNILLRNIPDDFLEPESKDLRNYLVQSLRLPSDWIHNALADKCRFNEDYPGQFQHLIYCERFHEAQDILVETLIPTIIINKNYKLAIDFLEKLEPQGQLIESYKHKAGILLEMLRLIHRIYHDKNATDTQLYHYHDMLYDICKKIKGFEIKNAEQGLCMAEISKCCAILLFMIFNKLDNPNRMQLPYFHTICQEMLQMPPDYKATDIELLSSDLLEWFHSYVRFSRWR